MTELHYLSATEAIEAFTKRTLSPVELLEAVIARDEAVEPTVNSLCHRFYDEAREQAREAERRYAGQGEPPRPLEGIPTAVKEEEAIAGQPWTMGSLIYKDHSAPHTSPFAERILASGAIVHARATAPEFSCAGFTHSRIWGVTRNPWNPEYFVGGSSGGSGAALAAGTATLASGSDIGGSIRLPASANGVVGFKPPYGRVPQDPPFNLDTFCHVGPMARTVSDCALFQNVVSGPHLRDIVSVGPKLVLPETFGPVDGLRIALSVDLGSWAVDPEIEANTLASAEALRSAGAIVEPVDVGFSREMIDRVAAVHFKLLFAAAIEQEVEGHRDLVNDYAAEFARWAPSKAGDATLLDEVTMLSELYQPLGAIFEQYDALICPTMGTRGLVAGDSYVGHGLEVGGVTLEHYFDSMMTVPFNALSRCPVLAVPSGFADNGVPTGLQIVGHPYDDETVFRVGAALEQVQPWFDAAERRPKL
jgi:Asp-tRNA(Asn)/Glu-tRNA(Gln) amidotransferase A subunit family amidase